MAEVRWYGRPICESMPFIGNGPRILAGEGVLSSRWKDDGGINGVHVGCIVTCRIEVDQARY